MVSRGIWHAHSDGKWYRFINPHADISVPDDESTFRTIQQLCDQPSHLENWEAVPFPTPIHSTLGYVYIVDQDAGVFIITLWRGFNGLLTPTAMRIDLARLCSSSAKLIQESISRFKYTVGENSTRRNPTVHEGSAFGALDIDLGIPTPLNELQERFFIDFVYIWRFYLDDPLSWIYSSPVFRVMSTAFLHLAAWDFELSTDYSDCEAEHPIDFAAIPSWDYPNTDIYWFHGFLVSLQESVASDRMIENARTKAKPYIDARPRCDDVHMILISPQHVTFVQLCLGVVLVSKPMALLTNHSALQCSPAFRALTRVLTSVCWKKPVVYRERWNQNLPPEILHNILHELEPREMVSFAQASFTVKHCYYASTPQIKNIVVENYSSSVPCCGIRGGLEDASICCQECFAWCHRKCVDQDDQSSTEQYICAICRENASSTTHVPGGINWFTGSKNRQPCHVRVGGSERSLHLRLSKPSHLQKEMISEIDAEPRPSCLVDYVVLFNSSFSGLAYGLESRI